MLLRKDVPELCQALCSQGVKLDWGEEQFQPQCWEDLQAVLVADGTLAVMDEEASYGQFDELESTLHRLGLGYDRYSGPHYTSEPTVAFWRRGWGTWYYRCTDEGGTVQVPVDELQRALRLIDGIAPAIGEEILQKLAYGVPDLPPLRVVDSLSELATEERYVEPIMPVRVWRSRYRADAPSGL